MTTSTAPSLAPSTWKAEPPPLARRIRMVMAIEVVPLALAIWGVSVVGVTRLGLTLFAAMYLLSMVGIELGMHRLVAHRAYTASSWLRVVLWILGGMAAEGSPLLWAAIHRVHHRDPDGGDDVHSPTHGRHGAVDRLLGFIWAQSLWYTEVPGILRFRAAMKGKAGDAEGDVQARTLVRVVEDWRGDPLVVTLDNLYTVWMLLGFALPAGVGFVVAGADGALTGLVWGGVVRLVAVQKAAFAVNSVCHTFGTRYLKSGDDSRNNVVMAILVLGQGWHNNHHAFPGSASMWFAPWQVDPTWLLIRALEAVGAVRDVRRIDPKIVEARRVR